MHDIRKAVIGNVTLIYHIIKVFVQTSQLKIASSLYVTVKEQRTIHLSLEVL